MPGAFPIASNLLDLRKSIGENGWTFYSVASRLDSLTLDENRREAWKLFAEVENLYGKKLHAKGLQDRQTLFISVFG